MPVLIKLLHLTICFILLNEVTSTDSKPVIIISSGGATFPLDIYKIWRPMYLSERASTATVIMTYSGLGSGTGIKRFKEKVYDFAGSDIVLPESDYDNRDDIQMFPTMAGPVSISYNIPNLPKSCANADCLNLTREAIVGIFNGSIQYWNHPLIVENNHVLQGVNASIRVIVRLDKSGTTELFTSALSAFSPKWRETYGSFSEGKPIKWNSTMNIQCGTTSFGAIGLIVNTAYSIGYCATSEARDSNLPDARILNRVNHWVKPSVETTLAAMDSFANALGTRLTGSIVDAPAEQAYPIAGYTYFLIRKRSMTNCTVTQELLRFFTFVLNDALAKSVVRDFIKAPISDRVLQLINNQVFTKMECLGLKVSDLVHVAVMTETGVYDRWKIPVAVCISLMMITFIITGAFYGYIHYMRNRGVLRGDYFVKLETFALVKERSTESFTASLSSTTKVEHSYRSGYSHSSYVIQNNFGDQYLTKPLCKHFDVEDLQWKTRRLLIQMKHDLLHQNVVKVLGIGKLDTDWKLVTNWPRKGRLQDIIHADKYHLNSGIRYAIVSDIVEGMIFLHKKEIIHGQLSSISCYIDGRWNCQVGDWEVNVLHHTEKAHFIAFESIYQTVFDNYPGNKRDANEYYQLLYSSPTEVLQQDRKSIFYVSKPTKAADVFSFGTVAYEVFSNLIPFNNFSMGEDIKWQPSMIVATIKSGNFWPSIPDDMRLEFPLVVELILSTWVFEPAQRPTFLQVGKMIRSANPKNESVIDTMMQAVESYALSLEEKVVERTVELERITKNMQNLLYNMLPQSAADKLSRGDQVEPEFYESVTLIFTDIVGFTSLAAISLPIQIVNLLNDLYITFDSVISHYDVYKVETIGDSYMCVSGLPNRNGINHAAEICTMALDILNIVPTINISHMPGQELRVRAGVHSGGVMAGVVGLKMPRFCLFGDTVNTAARMESSSLPMRIQISENTKVILDVFKLYEVHLRGAREVKGKGTMTTYWLTGKQDYSKQLPVFDPNDDDKLLSMLDKSQIK